MLKFTIGLIIIYKIELIADKDQNNTYVFTNFRIHKYYFGLCQQSIQFYMKFNLTLILNKYIIFNLKYYYIKLYYAKRV